MLKSLLVSLTILTSTLLLGSFLVPSSASAQVARKCDGSASFLGIPTWYKYLDVAEADDGSCDVSVPKDLDGNVEIQKVVGPVLLAIFEIILRIAGAAAVIFVIFGGVQYILSQGEPERTKGAKSTILNAFIGLAIAISATAIVNLIGKNLI